MTPNVIYVRHRGQEVTDSEWQEMLDDLAGYMQSAKQLRILVKTDDAGPNAKQRNALHQLILSKGATLRVAVMSTSVMVRGIVTAFSWMGTLDIKSFGDADFSGALRFLDAPEVTVATAMRTFADIERVVG